MSDGAALRALFDATDGEGWSNSDGWLYLEDLGQWHGVTTDAAGRVTALDLGGNGLSGELPEGLEYLTELTELDLRDNRLSGPMPAELGTLVNLEELYLNKKPAIRHPARRAYISHRPDRPVAARQPVQRGIPARTD